MQGQDYVITSLSLVKVFSNHSYRVRICITVKAQSDLQKIIDDAFEHFGNKMAI